MYGYKDTNAFSKCIFDTGVSSTRATHLMQADVARHIRMALSVSSLVLRVAPIVCKGYLVETEPEVRPP